MNVSLQDLTKRVEALENRNSAQEIIILGIISSLRAGKIDITVSLENLTAAFMKSDKYSEGLKAELAAILTMIRDSNKYDPDLE
jgi:hypothetical protein